MPVLEHSVELAMPLMTSMSSATVRLFPMTSPCHQTHSAELVALVVASVEATSDSEQSYLDIYKTSYVKYVHFLIQINNKKTTFLMPSLAKKNLIQYVLLVNCFLNASKSS